jgi:hypothetical protein
MVNSVPTLIRTSRSGGDDACEQARRLLRHLGLSIAQVVLVDIDPVLYLDCWRRPGLLETAADGVAASGRGRGRRRRRTWLLGMPAGGRGVKARDEEVR